MKRVGARHRQGKRVRFARRDTSPERILVHRTVEYEITHWYARVRRAMAARRMTFDALARALGTTRQGALELARLRRSQVLDERRLARLSAALGVTLESWLEPWPELPPHRSRAAEALGIRPGRRVGARFPGRQGIAGPGEVG